MKFIVRQKSDYCYDHDSTTLFINDDRIIINRHGMNGNPDVTDEYLFRNYFYIVTQNKNEDKKDELHVYLDLNTPSNAFCFQFLNISEKDLFLNEIKKYNDKQLKLFSSVLAEDNSFSLKLLQNENIFQSTLKAAKYNFSQYPQNKFRELPIFKSANDFNDFLYECIRQFSKSDDWMQWKAILLDYFKIKTQFGKYNVEFAKIRKQLIMFDGTLVKALGDFSKAVSEKYNRKGFSTVTLPFCLMINCIIKNFAVYSQLAVDSSSYLDIIKSASIPEIIDYYSRKLNHTNSNDGEIITFLFCFIQYYNLMPSKSIQEIIEFL